LVVVDDVSIQKESKKKQKMLQGGLSLSGFPGSSIRPRLDTELEMPPKKKRDWIPGVEYPERVVYNKKKKTKRRRYARSERISGLEYPAQSCTELTAL
jgi:hypothetical protein